MARMTLLEITQDILNDLNADEINSIDDTIEAQQVAQMVKSTFFGLMHERNWRGNQQLLQLIASGDDALPTHLTLPELLSELTFINYDCHRQGETRKLYKTIKYLYPDEFLRRQNGMNSDEANVDVIQDPTGVELLIRNDIPPTYWTSFDDKVVVFDAYDNLVDNTIQSNKIQAMGYLTPTWEMTDTFIPPIPEEAFTLLLEETKSRAALNLNQAADQKAEQTAQRHRRWLANKDWRAHKGARTPNYGRRGRK